MTAAATANHPAAHLGEPKGDGSTPAVAHRTGGSSTHTGGRDGRRDVMVKRAAVGCRAGKHRGQQYFQAFPHSPIINDASRLPIDFSLRVTNNVSIDQVQETTAWHKTPKTPAPLTCSAPTHRDAGGDHASTQTPRQHRQLHPAHTEHGRRPSGSAAKTQRHHWRATSSTFPHCRRGSGDGGASRLNLLAIPVGYGSRPGGLAPPWNPPYAAARPPSAAPDMRSGPPEGTAQTTGNIRQLAPRQLGHIGRWRGHIVHLHDTPARACAAGGWASGQRLVGTSGVSKGACPLAYSHNP